MVAAPSVLSEAAVEAGVFWSLPSGARITERYVIGDKIAEGANAAVYRALDEVTSEMVALKILGP